MEFNRLRWTAVVFECRYSFQLFDFSGLLVHCSGFFVEIDWCLFYDCFELELKFHQRLLHKVTLPQAAEAAMYLSTLQKFTPPYYIRQHPPQPPLSLTYFNTSVLKLVNSLLYHNTWRHHNKVNKTGLFISVRSIRLLNEFFYKASDFDSKSLQAVRLWIEKFRTKRISKWKFYQVSKFELKTLQRVKSWIEKFTTRQTLTWKFYSVSHSELGCSLRVRPWTNKHST